MYGGTISWLKDNIALRKKTIDELNESAQGIGPGSEGVIFIPALTGERTPYWNAKARGTLVGLEQKHHLGHVFRALLEANAYDNKRILELINNTGHNIDELIAIGGGSKSDLWLQIKADVLGIKVNKADAEEATVLGALKLILICNGKKTWEPKIIKKYYPGEDASVYKKLYAKYMKIKEKIDDIY